MDNWLLSWVWADQGISAGTSYSYWRITEDYDKFGSVKFLRTFLYNFLSQGSLTFMSSCRLSSSIFFYLVFLQGQLNTYVSDEASFPT